MRRFGFAIVSGFSCAAIVAGLCYMHGGGGLGIDGAVMTLAGAAGIVGFFAGLIAINV